MNKELSLYALVEKLFDTNYEIQSLINKIY